MVFTPHAGIEVTKRIASTESFRAFCEELNSKFRFDSRYPFRWWESAPIESTHFMRVVSTTNRSVSTDGSRVRKWEIPDAVSWNFEREFRVLRAFYGESVELTWENGTPIIEMPFFGRPLTIDDVTPAMLSQMRDILSQLHQMDVGLQDPADVLWNRLISRTYQRIGSPKCEMTEWIWNQIDLHKKSIVALGGNALVHTDPHLGNWLLDHDGTLRLIDFESVVEASPVVDEAVVLYSMFLHGRALPEVSEDVRSAIVFKAISSVSHQFVRNGEQAAKRHRDMLPASFWAGV